MGRRGASAASPHREAPGFPDTPKSNARREIHAERHNKVSRERGRLQNGADPSKFIENRDPEAINKRERERWPRGQATRRARLREAGHGLTENLQR